MKIWKRVVSLLLTFALLFTTATPTLRAYAAEGEPTQDEAAVTEDHQTNETEITEAVSMEEADAERSDTEASDDFFEEDTAAGVSVTVSAEAAASEGTDEPEPSAVTDEAEQPMAQEATGTEELPDEEAAEEPEAEEEPSEELAEEPQPLSEEPAEVPTGVYGSGSARYNSKDDDYRFYSEYFTYPESKLYTAGIKRQTKVFVYLKSGETAYFGSSVANSRMDVNDVTHPNSMGQDIAVTLPDGSKLGFDVSSLGKGYITDYRQERNGPRLNSADANDPTRYDPLTYTAEADGIYTFVFHSVTGENNGTNPATRKTTDSWQEVNGVVAAWDLTVVGLNDAGDAYEVKTGRIWANYLSLNSGSNVTGGKPTVSSLGLYVLTADGYTYKVDFREICPWGFIFFANHMGFTTDGTTKYSLYHSFYDADNALIGMESNEYVNIHRPYAADTETQQTYKIFFDEPSEELPASVRPRPAVPNKISDLNFEGSMPGLSYFSHGGTFTFRSEGASSVTISIDFRSALEELLADPDADESLRSYKGSGVVELSGAVRYGSNSFVWDGRDTSGEFIPVGLFRCSSIRLYTEAKVGEIHFPLIDAEGLYDGVTIERLTSVGDDTNGRYDIYYNNSPLIYGTIEGKGAAQEKEGSYFVLSDGTRSYDGSVGSSGGINYFRTKNGSTPVYAASGTVLDDRYVTTLHADTADYLAQQRFKQPFATLTAEEQAEIEAELAFSRTYHHEPVDSSSVSFRFANSSSSGGGNKAGMDVWAYYSTGADSYNFEKDLAIVRLQDTGSIIGRVFYDEDSDSSYDPEDRDTPLKGVVMQLMDADGNLVTSTERLPQFDENGYFLYENGKVVYKETTVEFRTKTNAEGRYIFSGVPYSEGGTTYYIQSALTQVQTDVLKYTPTTTVKAVGVVPGVTALDSRSGPDGNGFEFDYDEDSVLAVYDRMYGQTVFDRSNAQSVTMTPSKHTDVAFKDIGYISAVPLKYQQNYEVRKVWSEDTHPLPELVIELWYWDGDHLLDGNNFVTRHEGALIDTVKIDEKCRWSYTWQHLDNRLSYFVVEKYVKTKENGDIMYNDKGEERLVEIGSTMPAYTTGPDASEPYYPFFLIVSDYPEAQTVDGELVIPKQYYGDGLVHFDATTEQERQTDVDNNALRFELTYRLLDNEKTKTIELTNLQRYDEQEYYVWLYHERELPKFIKITHVAADGTKVREPVTLERSADGVSVKGLSITALDGNNNRYGNGTPAFSFDPNDLTGVLFTATDQRNYPEGTGTRSYLAEYTVDAEGRAVELDPNNGYEPMVPGDYEVFTWTITVHVYDVKPDRTILYNPDPYTPVVIQQGLSTDQTITWTVNADGTYTSNDTRTEDDSLLANDVIRVPLYQGAQHPTMGSCADIVGLAWSPDGTDNDLTYWDTNEGTNFTERHPGDDDYGQAGVGWSRADGKGGSVTLTLNTPRLTEISKGQDHANYASLTFLPNGNTDQEDVFYYKVVIFGEDITYNFRQYEDIDASMGVEMYTYFTLRPVTKDAKLAGATLSIGNEIDINYYVSGLTEETVSDYYMRFTCGSETRLQSFDFEKNLILEADENALNTRLYGYTYQNLFAYEMGNVVTATLLYSEDGAHFVELESREYSIRQYAERMLAQRETDTSGENEQLYEMLVDMLNFGTQAQHYAARQGWLDGEGSPVNYRIDPQEKQRFEAVQKAELADYAVKTEGAAMVQGVNLVFGEGMTLALKVTFRVEDDDLSGYSLVIRSDPGCTDHLTYRSSQTSEGAYREYATEKDPLTGEITLTNEAFALKGGRTYTVTICGIAPFFWDNGYRLSFRKNGAEISSLTYSVNSYCYDMLEQPELSGLLRSMVRYNVTAKAWYYDSEEGYQDVYGDKH